ncbi:MAG: Calx-beta domain-containing protein [Caldilineaceae bacterium]
MDDDTAGTTVSPINMTIGEPNVTGAFTIALTSEPIATVTVNLFSTNNNECSVPGNVKLNSTNWRTGAKVVVTPVDDDIDDETQHCTIQTTAISAGDPNYNAIAVANVNVAVTDDEVAGVVVSPSALVIGEPNGSSTFSITLTSEPTQTVTVNLHSDDLSECSVPATAVLNAANWNTGVFVSVQAADDQIDDADQLCTVDTTVTSTDGDYAGIAATDVAVTVQDDSDTAGIVVSATALTVSEPSTTARFTVTLTSEPLAAVAVNFLPDDGSECRAPTAVTLSPTNWQSGIGVEVSAVNDDVDDGTQLCTLQTTATSSDGLYNGMAVDDVAVTVQDEDVAGMVQSTLALTVTEPTGVGHYTITLTSEPVAAVVVNLVSDDTTACTVPASVALDATNWRGGVAVPVSAVNDDVDDDIQICGIQSTVSSNDPLYHSSALAAVATTVLDEDVAGVVVAPAALSINELAGQAPFTVSLTSEPTAPVVVALTSADAGECAVPANVTLDAGNWRAGLPVQVTAVDDFKVDGDQACVVTTDATSQDAKYHQIVVTDVTATVVDDDSFAVRFAPSTPVVREPDTQSEVLVRLGSQPAAAVALTFSTNNPDECVVTASATLDPANWREGVPVTVTAVDDTVDDGPQTCVIATTASSSDSDYNNLAVAALAVTVEDNDRVTMDVTLQASTETVEIGDIVTYTYRVVNTGDVALTVAAVDSALGTVTFDQATIAPNATAIGKLTYQAQQRSPRPAGQFGQCDWAITRRSSN